MVRPFHTYIASFDVPNQSTRQGAKCRVIWLIGQVLQRSRWIDSGHRRPVFRTLWTTLWLSYGQPERGENYALPENAKNRSHGAIYV